MNRFVTLLAVAAVAAGCSESSDVPGAMLRGPGALAVFDGLVAHETGTLRKYLAIGNERGDELRLVDLTDNEMVVSPGLAFPLSVPTEGRPMWIASVDLCDDAALLEKAAGQCTDDLPDALVVIAAGSNVVEVVDTWSGQPRVSETYDLDVELGLAPDAEVVSIAGVRVPSRDGVDVSPEREWVRTNVGRILVGLTGGRLAVLDLVRQVTGEVVIQRSTTAPVTPVLLTGLGFNPLSLSQGVDPRRVYAASRTEVSTGVWGAAELTLPPAPGGELDYALAALDAGAPTDGVAALRLGDLDRVIAAPVPGGCGDGAFACLRSLDPAAGGLAENLEVSPGVYVDGLPALPPLPIPGTVAGLLAHGRVTGATPATIRIASGSGTTETTGVAVVSSTDGAVYLVDVQRWTMISEANPVLGAGMTRVSAASAVAGPDAEPTDSSLGLWILAGQTLAPALSADADALAARIRITPGFTPDDTWTLAWQGILPGLDGRGAELTVTSATAGTLSIPIGSTDPATLLDLAARGVVADDRVELAPVGACEPSALLTVSPITATEVALSLPVGKAWADVCVTAGVGATASVDATFRAGGLVLTGAAHGLAGRPPEFVPTEWGTGADADRPLEAHLAANEFQVGGERRFYVPDACLDPATCDPAWMAAPFALSFPYPTGPMLGFAVGFVDPACTGALKDCVAAAPDPVTGTAITFTTRSGLVPSPRRPVIDGSVVAAALPSGLALWDNGDAGLNVQASYTAGLVMVFQTHAGVTTMAVVR